MTFEHLATAALTIPRRASCQVIPKNVNQLPVLNMQVQTVESSPRSSGGRMMFIQQKLER